MFGQRKFRKSSPDPEDRYKNDSASNVDAPPNNSTPQNRRRVKPRDSVGEILDSPLARRKSTLPLYTAPGTSTCNSFLLGGQYYPGKGKKTKHYHRRTLWYRVFCSTSWRKVLTTIVIAYMLIWQVLVPSLNAVLDYGKVLAGGQQPSLSKNLSDLKLPPIEQQREEAEKLKRMKDELNKGDSRLKLLEKIVPDWYHRNDNKANDANGGVEEKARMKDESTPIAIDGKRNSNDPHDDDNARVRPRSEPKRRGKTPPEETPITTAAETPPRHHVNDHHQDEPKRDNEKAVEIEAQEEKLTKDEAVKASEKVITPSPVGATNIAKADKDRRDGAAEATEKKNRIDASSVKDPATKDLQAKMKQAEKAEENASAAKAAATTKDISADIKQVENAKEEAASIDDKSHHQLPPGMNEDGSVFNMERMLQTMDDYPNQSHCPSNVTSISTTLLVQCSLDRMWILQETCRRWVDPIVAVVHLANKNDSISDEWKTTCPQMTVVPYMADKKEKAWHYPVNRLRNLGLDMVQTSHVIVVDVDFVPSQGLDQTIRNALEERQKQRNVADSTVALEERDAIVVPAFERVEDCSNDSVDCSHFLRSNSSYLPKTKDELQSCIVAKNCIVFQAKTNWEGHFSTQSHKWLNGEFYEDQEITLADDSKSKVLKRVPCFDSLRYEPYVVIRWCPVSSSSSQEVKPVGPYYDQRFYGYGKNKIQMISHLRFLGYQFSILPEGFIVHNPHVESKAKKVWNDVQDYKLHETMDALYPQFLKELLVKYKTVTDPRTIVLQCERDKKKQL